MTYWIGALSLQSLGDGGDIASGVAKLL